ncbi:MAG: succinylglutamate desuccinylase/aspartoacylase family protein [Myxococcota bacterium]
MHPTVTELDLQALAPGRVHHLWLHLVDDKLGHPIRLPIVVARGSEEGPVLGLTAALHGNELNGIPIIHRVFAELDAPGQGSLALKGTVVGVPGVNVPGMLLEQRVFNDGEDPNRLFPGVANGNTSQVFVHRFLHRVVAKLDQLLDLHTASFGRVNSFYARADMGDAGTQRMARLQNPRIILNNPPNDRTMRGAAAALGVRAVTLELQDPFVFQEDVITNGAQGVKNLLVDAGMIEGELLCAIYPTTVCERSYWLYTDVGGILTVFPEVAERVRAGQRIARVTDLFGKVVREYEAPEDGIVIGKSVNPLNQTGSRILHLGIGLSDVPCLA